MAKPSSTEANNPTNLQEGSGAGLWICTLFAAEEIPAAIVTFVSLLMFLQLGTPIAEATLFTALISIPWILKSFMRSWVRRTGYFKQVIHIVEGLLFLSLIAIALTFPMGRYWLLPALFVVNLLAAWHALAASMYYERMLYPRYQRFYNRLKGFAAQTSVVMTYGVLIIVVGLLEIRLHNYSQAWPRAWSMGCYMIAGVFLLFTLLHLLILRRPAVGNNMLQSSLARSWKAEVHVIERIRRQPDWWRDVLMLQLLLLPQSLMFQSRVYFLWATPEMGGLGSTIQDIGFAQGTVGVIAFSLGIALGRRISHKHAQEHLFWPLSLALGLSPVIYLIMSFYPPQTLMHLCGATFSAQLLFGLGLTVCKTLVQHISGERYRNTINLLYIPLISACMLVPMAISGWLVQAMGFQNFFILNTLSAPVAWCMIGLLRKK